MSDDIKHIRINVLMHEKTGLMLATSPDHKGLYVHGRTPQELEERIPLAIKALLEAEGKQVLDIIKTDERVSAGGFGRIDADFEATVLEAA